MSNSKLAVIISSILLGAATAHAGPSATDQSAADQSQQTQATASTSTTTTQSTTEAPDTAGSNTAESSTSAPAATTSPDYDATNRGASAQEAANPDMKAKERWAQADIDGNGTLSLAEIQASMPSKAQKFTQMDANNDGELSTDEMHSYKLQHGQRDLQQKFSSADRDGDSMLDQTEAQGMPTLTEQFATVDANSDGKISLEEMRAHHLAMGGEWSEEGDKTSEADELRTTTSSTSTTSTTTSTEKPDDSSTTSER